MQIQVINAKTSDYGSFHFEATCGKTSAFVSIHSRGVNVICQNASHKAWGGMGRSFKSLEEAVNAYKKAEMKQIITAAAFAQQANTTAH